MKSMGGVAVLHPQDSLNSHPDNFFSKPKKSHRPIKFNHTYTNSPSPTPNLTDSRRRTSPKGTLKKNNRYTEAVASAPPASKNLMMGQVNLLKRGETLNQYSGPDPKMLSKQMKNNTREFFAGSAFVDSPPPSSVPIPGFFTKNFVAAVRDDPTIELRRILGLSSS